MIRYLLVALCTALVTLTADETPLRVTLATNSPLTPVYVATLDTTTSTYPASYTAELERTLHFDLQYGGTLSLVPHKTELEARLSELSGSASLNPKIWSEAGVAFAIKPTLTQGALSIDLLTVKTGSLKRFRHIPLSGNTIDDRRRIHTVTDAMHEAITGQKGVASTTLLYAFQEKDSKGRWLSEIWQCDYDGANAHQVTREEGYAITPAFVPPSSGRRATTFSYVTYKQGQPKIYLSSLGKERGTPCVSLRGNQLLPTFSATASTLAFISDAAGSADLFVQAFDRETGCIGKPIQAYSFPSSVHASPTFSPDGSELAFVSDKDGTPRVYVIATPRGGLDGGLPKAKCLTTLHRDNTCPAWSPDGTKIAYSAKVAGIRQIMLYDCESKRETQLTTGPGHKENPSWAPNSLHIVYNSITPAESQLYIVDTCHKQSHQITRGVGRKHYPAWEP